MNQASPGGSARPRHALVLVVASTVLGLMGTDLVLPAVPQLPEALGGTAAMAQMVLAAYVAGSCAGLLLYGALGDRVSTHRLFMGSLIATALTSLACGAAKSIEALVALRALQGAAACGPAVFAPALVRALLDERRAVRAMGAIGSIESLAPALAPVAGAALLAAGGWRLSFGVLAAGAGLLVLALLLLGRLPQTSRRARGSYGALLRDGVFMRYALSHALVLGGLLTFVFGMPVVLVRVLGATFMDFIVMQVLAIATFMLAANLAGSAVARFGAEPVISWGTALAAAGAAAAFVYALTGGRHPLWITACFMPVNVGLGLRGPPGFYRAVVAAKGDDARGSALVVLFILAVAAGGTALTSRWIDQGLTPLAAAVLALELGAVGCLLALPRMQSGPQAA